MENINDTHAKAINKHKVKIELLKSWCDKNDIVPSSITDCQLVQFLNCCEYDLEEAKKVITTNYSIKAKSPEIFQERDPLSEVFEKVWSVTHLNLLPKPTTEGYRILYLGFKETDPKKFDLKNAMKLFNMILDTIINKETLTPGFIAILDARGVSLLHFPITSLLSLRRELQYLQEGIQVRIKGVHVINCSPVVEKIYIAVKPFLNANLVRILNFHQGEMIEFYKKLPKELLPEELGGMCETYDDLSTSMRKNVEGFRDWFQWEEKQRAEVEKIASVGSSLKDLQLD